MIEYGQYSPITRDFTKRLHAANEHRTIKPENWQTLAGSVSDLFAISAPCEIVDAIRAGKPSAENMRELVNALHCIVRNSYNGTERKQGRALAQTLVNYRLVHADDVRTLLPE